MNKPSIWIISICVLLLSACSSTPTIEKPKLSQNDYSIISNYLSEFIPQKLEENNVTGVSIGLVAQGKLIWAQGFGYADIKRKNNVVANNRFRAKSLSKEKVTSSSKFRAGSLSKTINALKIIQMVEQGKLELDRPITHYIPEFNLKTRFNDTEAITLTHLLSHQAGVPSDLIKGMWVENPISYKKALGYLNDVYAATPPNTVHTYSNLGFDIVGLIIERVEGAPYEQVMNGFLKELGMRSSVFTALPEQPPTVNGYEKGKPKKELGLRDVPAAGLTSNVIDLAQLLMVLTNEGSFEGNHILTEKYFELLQRDYSSDKPLNFGKRVGLGLFFREDIFHEKLKLFSHNGATPSHRASFVYAPDHEFGIAILSNSANAGTSLFKIASEAISLLYQAGFGKNPPKKHLAWPKNSKVDRSDNTPMTGYYATRLGLARFYEENSELKVSIAGRRFNLYRHIENGPLYLKYKLFNLFPISLGYMDHIGLTSRQVGGEKFLIGYNTLNDKQFLGQAIEQEEIHPAWIERVGKYRVVTPLEAMDIPKGGLKIVDGFLVAYASIESGEQLQYVIRPVNNDEAIVAGVGRGLGETIFAYEENGKSYLKFSNIIFEKL